MGTASFEFCLEFVLLVTDLVKLQLDKFSILFEAIDILTF